MSPHSVASCASATLQSSKKKGTNTNADDDSIVRCKTPQDRNAQTHMRNASKGHRSDHVMNLTLTRLPAPQSYKKAIIQQEHDAPQEPHAAHSTPAALAESSTALSAQQQSAELESHLTALGHTLYLKNQRDTLRASLSACQTDRSRLRTLSFRLAAQVAIRDATIKRRDRIQAQTVLAGYLDDQRSADVIKRLRDTVHSYEEKGRGLLTSLSSTAGTGEMQRSSTTSLQSESSDTDDAYLPSEILEICQYRVDALLRECRLSKDTLVLLRETEASLRQDAKAQDEKIQELQQQTTQSDAQLRSLNSQMSKVLDDLAHSQQQISCFTAKRKSLQDIINESNNAKQNMQQEREAANANLRSTQNNLQQTQLELQAAIVKADMLTKAQTSLEDIVQNLRSKTDTDQFSLRQTHCQLAGAKEQLQNLQHDKEQQASAIAALRQDLAELQSKIEQQQTQAEEARFAADDRDRQSTLEIAEARAACMQAERQQTQLLEEQERLKKSETRLRAEVKQQTETSLKLESSHREAANELVTIKETHQRFIESSESLSQELEGEKAKTLALIETEARLRAQIVDHEQIVKRLNSHIADLQASLAVEAATTKRNADQTQRIEHELQTSKQTLQDVHVAHRAVVNEMSQTEEELRKALRNASQEIDSLKTSLLDAQAHAVKLSQENNDLQAAVKEAHSVADKANESRDIARSLNESNQRSIADHIKQHEEVIIARDQSIKEIALQRDAIALERDELRVQYKALGKERSSLKSQLGDTRMQLARREAMKKDQDLTLRTQRARAEHLKNAREELLAKLRIKDNECIHLDEQVISLNINLEDIQDRFASTSNNLKQSETQVSELTKAKNNLEHLGFEKDSTIHRLTHQLGHKREELDRLTIVANDDKEQLQSLRNDLEQHKSQRAQLDLALAEQKAQTTALRTQLDNQTKQSIDLNVQLRNLRRSGAAQVCRLSELEAKNKLLEDQASELNATTKTLDAKNTSLTEKATELEAKVQSRERANSTFHQQFRALQKRVTEADRRIEDLGQTLARREAEIQCLQQARKQSMHDIKQAQQQVALHNTPSRSRGFELGDNRPVTPKRGSSASTPQSSSPAALVSRMSNRRRSAYSQRASSSPTDSIDHDSLLRSSISPSVTPSRQDTMMSATMDEPNDSVEALADLRDVTPTSKSSHNHREDMFGGQRASTSHSMRSTLSQSWARRTLDLTDREHAHESATTTALTRETGPASASSSPLRRRGASRSIKRFIIGDDLMDDRKAWAEKHPRLWRLVYGKRDNGERIISNEDNDLDRGTSKSLPGHRRAVSHRI